MKRKYTFVGSLGEVKLARSVSGAGREAVAEGRLARGSQAPVGQLYHVVRHVDPLVDKVHGSRHLNLTCSHRSGY